MEKKGQILVENVVFIILNLIFLSILILFIMTKGASEAALEDKYSKQIALLIDSAEPGTDIYIDMEDAFEKAEGNKFREELVRISNGEVIVKLRENGEHSYPFFNNVEVFAFKYEENVYWIQINKYN